jgi:hypothetical protein
MTDRELFDAIIVAYNANPSYELEERLQILWTATRAQLVELYNELCA